MSKLLIKGQGLGVVRRGRRLLDGVDIQVSAGEIVTVVGPNGAGKTTLLRLLLGLMKADEGAVWRARRLRIGYVPQKLAIERNLPLTVERFLATTGMRNPATIKAALEAAGIAGLMTAQLADLSGGELQRATVARALLRDPQLLVLDEPTRGVDLSGEIDLYALISRLKKENHCGVLLVSHDLHLVMGETDRVLCINGHLCCSGHPESVTAHPEYRKLFGRAAAQQLAVYAHHHDHRHEPGGGTVPIEQANQEAQP